MSAHLAAPRLRPQKPQTRSRALRLVAPVSSRARKAPFVVVVLTLLGAGLVGLILISTVLQAQSFEAARLSDEADALQTQQQALSREVDRMQSPSNIAQRALQLGMVPSANPIFLRITDGEVIGKAVPAPAKGSIRRVTQ
ncbi:septum formation initiator family protein [Aeromicrobium terrae]|uniref:Septum formation initiator family protein n=1 Tax=Aeromicrobium terrae TaxID=2498846 RepID=A0A5C8NNH7_9ACTN|nr:septum formation initiator family protein [Aeromicrobium terrae]TXL62832.1 septum formation initiator family protein [Aeromicrobium terrae]